MWVVFEHGKKVFCLFFSGFHVFVVCFCVFGKVAKALNMFCFLPVWGGLWGGLFLFIWVWRFRCFVCFLFLFFLFRFWFLFVLFFVVGLFLVLFLFLFFFGGPSPERCTGLWQKLSAEKAWGKAYWYAFRAGYAFVAVSLVLANQDGARDTRDFLKPWISG